MKLPALTLILLLSLFFTGCWGYGHRYHHHEDEGWRHHQGDYRHHGRYNDSYPERGPRYGPPAKVDESLSNEDCDPRDSKEVCDKKLKEKK